MRNLEAKQERREGTGDNDLVTIAYTLKSPFPGRIKGEG